jgi:hypothetical protein
MKQIILTSILLTFLYSLGISGQTSWPWQKDAEKTDLIIDFSKRDTFDEIKIELTAVGDSKFKDIKMAIANTDISISTSVTEPISGNTIIIDIKKYLTTTGKWESISALKDEKQLTVTIDRENGEYMKFIYKIKPSQPNLSTKEFTPFYFPVFSYSFDTTSINKKHRILVIDGTPRGNINRGFNVKKWDSKKDAEKWLLKDANALVTGRSLSVFTKNIGLRNLDYIRVSINGIDYTFNAGVSDLFDSAIDLNVTSGELSNASSSGSTITSQNQANQDFFASILNDLNKIHELTIEDFQTLQRYQSVLSDSIKGKRLDPESLLLVSRIISFTPKYLNITSFPLSVPNNDEVTISTEVKYKGGQPITVPSGTYKTNGALSVNVGSAIYLTGLKNNNIYIETIKVNDQLDEQRARIDEDDQLSVGIGINSEITYRTGSIFRPSANFGFFVPFDEDITPFIAIGPGLAIIDHKVSLSLSGGFAFGKINSISERYRDIDLNTIPNFSELELIQKIWSNSWYFSIGVGFNISSND